MIEKFMKNEFYSIHKRFEVLAEKPINDLKDFVKCTATELKLFQFECSKKNPLHARLVIETIRKECSLLGTPPSLWIGYNAFNAILHGKLKKTFEAQKNLEAKIFEMLLTY
jgi:hypothetical protein